MAVLHCSCGEPVKFNRDNVPDLIQCGTCADRDAFDVTNCDEGIGAPDFVQAGQWIADWYIGDVTSYDDLLTEEMQQLVDADERRSK